MQEYQTSRKNRIITKKEMTILEGKTVVNNITTDVQYII